MTNPQLPEILQVLHRKLKQILDDQLEMVLLYGSQARGEAKPDSDIDILVIVRDNPDYGDLIQRTSKTVSELSLRYDVVISRAFVSIERYKQEQSPFLMNVRREGVTV